MRHTRIIAGSTHAPRYDPPTPTNRTPAGFRPAWRACPADTAVKHLDVDAPRLFKGLYEQDVSGEAPRKGGRLLLRRRLCMPGGQHEMGGPPQHWKAAAHVKG